MRNDPKKRAKGLLIGLIMLLLLGACSGSNGGSNQGDQASSKPPASDSGTGQESQTPTETEEGPPFELTIMANLHTPEVPSDKIKELLEQKTNTKLNIIWVPDGTYDEKLNASFATNSLPQATYLKNQASLIMFRDAIRNNQFWEIGPYLSEYDNLSNLMPEVLNNTSVDGKIYALYQERPLARQGIIYRKDWADALKLSAPETLEDLYEMLKAFTNGDPDQDGQSNTIGLTDRSDLIYGAFKTIASYHGTPNGWGLQDGRLAPEFDFPEYMDTLKYFRMLFKEGLINQEFPVTSKNDQQNLLITGKAGVYVGSMGDVQTLYNKLIEVDPSAELEVKNEIAGPDGYKGIWSIPGFGSVVLFPKSAVKDETELRRILTFYNDLMSPELANLIYWGVEDEHYKVEDGAVIVSEDAKLLEREVKPYQALQIGGISTINMYDAKHVLPVKAKAEELIKENNKQLINDPTAPLDSKTFGEQGIRLGDIIKDASYQFMLDRLDEEGFQKEVDRWYSEGGQKIVDEFNESYERSK